MVNLGSRAHRSFSETEALVDGVERCGGAGRWQDIKRLEYRALTRRSAVDLKDKCGRCPV